LRALIAKNYPDMEYDVDCKIKNKTNYLQELRLYLNLDFKPYSPQQARQRNCLKGKNIIIQKMLD